MLGIVPQSRNDYIKLKSVPLNKENVNHYLRIAPKQFLKLTGIYSTVDFVGGNNYSIKGFIEALVIRVYISGVLVELSLNLLERTISIEEFDVQKKRYK